MRTLTRALILLVSPCLLMLSSPAGPAQAADPAVLVCTEAKPVTNQLPTAKKQCDFYDSAYELVVYDYCVDTVRGIPSPTNINDNIYFFSGARAGGNWVAATVTTCWIGDAVAQEGHTGQWGVMAAQTATGPLSQQNQVLCTQWYVQFKAGNPFSRDPDTFYGTTAFCGQPPLLTIP